MVKEDVEDFYGFYFSLLFYTRFSFTQLLSRVCEKVNWKNYFEFLVLAGGHLLL